MKNIVFLMIFIYMISACESISKIDVAFDESCFHMNNIRSYDEAYAFAEQSLQLLSNSPLKSGEIREIENCECLLSNTTKSGVTDTLLYIFNFSDSLGFSVISANRSLFPIIAVTEKGRFNIESFTGIPPVDDYFNDFIQNNAKGALSTRIPEGNNGISTLIKIIYSADVPPLIDVNWGQSGIYGQFCPNGVSGCVATAIAQIFSVHRYPASFVSTVDMDDVYQIGDVVTLDWDNILHHLDNHDDAQQCSPYHYQISALLREIGAQVYMNYKPLGSSEAYSINVMNALDYFDYQSDGYSIESILDILSSLNNGRPVYMQGVDDCNTDTYSDDVGHAWVIDGYVEYVTTIDSYENGQLIGSFPYDDYHVMHINWGWDGVCNGYFYFGEYDTSGADSYDGVYYGAYDFDSQNKMYTNIRK